jgi:lysophospholipase L1-like esterase
MVEGDRTARFRRAEARSTFPGDPEPAEIQMRTRFLIPIVVVTSVLSSAAPSPAAAQRPDSAARAEAAAATAADHRRMLDLFGIDELRPGPSGDPSAPNAANSDEARVPPYALPDPLVTEDGRAVTTAREWWTVRRPEIVEAFDREVYGRVPPDVPPVAWQVTDTARAEVGGAEVGGVAVVKKSLVGRASDPACPGLDVGIELEVVTPAAAAGPVPVMIHFGFRFPPGFQPPPSATPGGPGWRSQLLERGWGYAELIPTSYQPDSGAGLARGIIGLSSCGRPRAPDDWGVLRAWAWGASRALDYLETDPGVDGSRVGIEGLSRYGKAALVALAYDPRFAVGFIGSSGAGGAKILRRVFGEQVENLASAGEYHWFAGNFLRYAGPLTPADLPVDAHQLVALAAPRPVFISVGSPAVEGQWVDARGMFLAGVHAGPVYELLGARSLGTDAYPPMETALVDGEVAFRQHAAGHTTGPNWPTFLEWADRYIGARADTWVGTWGTAPQLTEPRNLPPEPGLAGNTLRQIVHVSIGGQRLRLRFSNEFGTGPVTLRAVRVADSRGGDAIDVATDRALTFEGRASVTIPPGEAVTSDPFAYALRPLSDLAVTIHFGEMSDSVITGHPGSRTTSHLQEGEAAAAPTLPDAARTDHWYILTGIDVVAPGAPAVVTLGNSITDGRGSGTNEQNRWPDELARRLQADPATRNVAVLNMGIGGNCVLEACLGPPAVERFERDVLAQSGVRWLVVFEGINDIGQAEGEAEAADVARRLIAAYEDIITRSHARDIEVYGATLLPFGGSFYDTPAREAARRTVNEWIRESGAFDAVIDLDAALGDPDAPDRLHPALDTGDHLHPNEAGHRAMAEAIDLSLFRIR